MVNIEFPKKETNFFMKGITSAKLNWYFQECDNGKGFYKDMFLLDMAQKCVKQVRCSEVDSPASHWPNSTQFKAHLPHSCNPVLRLQSPNDMSSQILAWTALVWSWHGSDVLCCLWEYRTSKFCQNPPQTISLLVGPYTMLGIIWWF